MCIKVGVGYRAASTGGTAPQTDSSVWEDVTAGL